MKHLSMKLFSTARHVPKKWLRGSIFLVENVGGTSKFKIPLLVTDAYDFTDTTTFKQYTAVCGKLFVPRKAIGGYADKDIPVPLCANFPSPTVDNATFAKECIPATELLIPKFNNCTFVMDNIKKMVYINRVGSIAYSKGIPLHQLLVSSQDTFLLDGIRTPCMWDNLGVIQEELLSWLMEQLFFQANDMVDYTTLIGSLERPTGNLSEDFFYYNHNNGMGSVYWRDTLVGSCEDVTQDLFKLLPDYLFLDKELKKCLNYPRLVS